MRDGYGPTGDVGDIATTFRDISTDPFYRLKMAGRRHPCIGTAYSALVGMGDGAVEEPDEVFVTYGGISDILERRRPSDPLRSMSRTYSTPTAGRENLMAHADKVADEMNCGGRDTDGDLARYTGSLTSGEVSLRDAQFSTNAPVRD